MQDYNDVIINFVVYFIKDSLLQTEHLLKAE